MTYPETPQEIAQELGALRAAAVAAWERQDWEVAAGRFEETYRFLLEQQGRFNLRFHKGWELYNGGVALLRADEYRSGLQRILLAYVEDVLSADLGEETTADLQPARLGWVGIENTELFFNPLLEAAMECKGRDVPCLDPQEIYERARDQFPSAPEEAVWQLQAQREERRRVEELRHPYERRCFIGCNYFSGGPNFQDIKEAVGEERFDPIVARDFDVSEAGVHHHSLLLLHLCKKAVFEVTLPAGQLMELERCRDYSIRPLILRQVMPGADPADAVVSAMIETMADQNVRTYSTIAELKGLVREYLRNHSSS